MDKFRSEILYDVRGLIAVVTGGGSGMYGRFSSVEEEFQADLGT